MPSSLATGPKKTAPAPAVGCATCWAANYCAAFSSLASPQPPPACPLVPKRKLRAKRLLHSPTGK